MSFLGMDIARRQTLRSSRVLAGLLNPRNLATPSIHAHKQPQGCMRSGRTMQFTLGLRRVVLKTPTLRF